MRKKEQIKTAKKHHLKKIFSLFTDINANTKKQEIEKMIENKEVLVLKKRKKIQAAIAYSIIGVGGLFSIMYVKKIAVAKSQRGKGTGSFILKHIKNLSKKKGTQAILLFSLVKARSFYKKNKFKNFFNFFWKNNK